MKKFIKWLLADHRKTKLIKYIIKRYNIPKYYDNGDKRLYDICISKKYDIYTGKVISYKLELGIGSWKTRWGVVCKWYCKKQLKKRAEKGWK